MQRDFDDSILASPILQHEQTSFYQQIMSELYIKTTVKEKCQQHT